MAQKTVVTVRIGENVSKLKNEGPPSDFWSWRKYGQKPIKGSPYPRFYINSSLDRLFLIPGGLMVPHSNLYFFLANFIPKYKSINYI